MASDDPRRPGPGKGRRNDIPWNKIQSAYEGGETNITTLAQTFGVKRDSIAKHRDKEKWATKGQIAEAARSNVIDMATRRAVEQLGGQQAITAAASDIANNLQRIPALYAKAGNLIDTMIDKAINGTLKLGVTQGETTALNDILGAMSKYTRDNRLDAGLKEGTASTDASKSDDDEQRVEQAVLIVRERKAEVA
jgi:hypothetical protein